MCKILLVPKIDLLWKHEGKTKALANMDWVRQGEYYLLMKNQHARNKQIYFAKQIKVGDIIVQMVA
jgi:hypothetical protein